MTENSLLELHVKDPYEAVLLLGTVDSHLSLI